MKQPIFISLPNGTKLTIEQNILLCQSPSGELLHLTAGQQKLLRQLAMHLNKPVPFDVLYASYASDCQQLTYIGNINSNIAKMKRTFPDCIKSCIRNIRNIGYCLEGTTVQTASSPKTEDQFLPIIELAGDYYGYYLDPLGSKALLSAYLHIEAIGTTATQSMQLYNAQTEVLPQLNAYLVLGIRSEQILLSQELPLIFSSKTANYKEAFQTFKETLNENEKRCSFGQGTVSADGSLAVMKFALTQGTFEILIDMDNYIKSNRKKEGMADYYRGGMGISIATRCVHGTYCLRLGLIKTTLFNEKMHADHEKILEMLKISDGSRQADWKPLKLSGWLDKCWYNWILNTQLW